jgi:hypothetical protein
MHAGQGALKSICLSELGMQSAPLQLVKQRAA